MSARAILAAAVLLSTAPDLGAHEAKLDKLGCHHLSQPPGYHCHSGALAGRQFPTKYDALLDLDERRDAPGWSWPAFTARLWELLGLEDEGGRSPNK